MADICQEEKALLRSYKVCDVVRANAGCQVSKIIRTVAGAPVAGLQLASVDQAEIRGLVTTGHSVRRGAASDFMSRVTLIA